MRVSPICSLIITGCLVLACYPSFAQPGIAEMQQANAEIRRSFFSAFDASLVLAGIFGIFGALKIYHNWQMGKDRITPDVAAWFFSALFMILIGPFLRALFGI